MSASKAKRAEAISVSAAVADAGQAEVSGRTILLLFAGFVALAVLFTLSSYWIWSRQAESDSASAEQALSRVAASKAAQVSQWAERGVRDADTLSSNAIITAAARSAVAGGGEASALAKARASLDRYLRDHEYKSALLVSSRGAPLLIAPSTASDSMSDVTRVLAARAVAEARTALSRPYLDSSGDPRFDVAAPVFEDDRRTRPIAALILRGDPRSALLPLIDGWPLAGRSGEALLVERVGDRIVYLSNPRYWEGPPLSFTFSAAAPYLPEALAARGAGGIVNGQDYRAKPVLAAASAVKGTSWFVVAKADTGEVLSSISLLGLLIAALAFTLVALAGSGTLLLFRSREAEAAATLVSSEQKYRALYKNMAEGVALCEPIADADGKPIDYRIVDVNPAYAKHTGMSTERTCGSLASEAYAVNPPPFLSEVAAVAGTGKARRFDAFCAPLGRHLDITLISSDGGRVGMVMEDITARKEAERRLRESRSRYRSLFQNSPIPLWEEDWSGFKQYLDALRASGVTDFPAYLEEHAEALHHCYSLLRLTDANDACLEFYGAANKADLATNMESLFTRESGIIRKSLIAIAQGQSSVVGKGMTRTIKDDERHVTLHVRLSPGQEDKWEKVIISAIDLTTQKRAENTLRRLNAKLAKEESERRLLSQRLMEIGENERRSLAMELHDHFGQLLTALKMRLEDVAADTNEADGHLCAAINDSIERTTGIMDDVRRLASGLMPNMIEDLGLVPALEALVDGVAVDTDLDVQLFVSGVCERADREHELAIYRIVQEGLNNIVKHAHARKVFVNLIRTDDILRLSIEDDGVGFDRSSAGQTLWRRGPLGLHIIRERVVQFGGELSIDSRPGCGVHISAEIPWSESSARLNMEVG